MRCDHRGCGLVRPAPRPVLHPTRRAPTPDSLTEELRARTAGLPPGVHRAAGAADRGAVVLRCAAPPPPLRLCPPVRRQAELTTPCGTLPVRPPLLRRVPRAQRPALRDLPGGLLRGPPGARCRGRRLRHPVRRVPAAGPQVSRPAPPCPVPTPVALPAANTARRALGSDLPGEQDQSWVRQFGEHWRRNEAAVRRAVGGPIRPAAAAAAAAAAPATTSAALAKPSKKRARAEAADPGLTYSGLSAEPGESRQAQRLRTSSAGEGAAAASQPKAGRTRKQSPRKQSARDAASAAGGIPKRQREPDLPAAVLDAVLLRRSTLASWCSRSDFASLVRTNASFCQACFVALQTCTCT